MIFSSNIDNYIFVTLHAEILQHLCDYCFVVTQSQYVYDRSFFTFLFNLLGKDWKKMIGDMA